MAEAGDRHSSKGRFWRQMVRQWLDSGQSVRAFCRAHNLAEGSFYAWRRTIASEQRDQQAGCRRGLNGPSRSVSPPLFIPVQLSAVAAAPLEVVLQGGRVVRVPTGFDATTLRQLLAVLAEAPPC
jgi:transposase-like protein